MTTRKQIVIAGGFVLAAAAAVLMTALLSDEEEAMPPAPAPAGEMAGMPGMDMPANDGGIMLDDAAASRIGLAFAVAEMRPFAAGIQTVGTVKYDETRVTSVSPKVEGWVERLYVDFTGATVRRGEPLLTLYSPTLVTAQEELILARRLMDSATGTPESRPMTNARELLDAARRRLRYWDVSEEEIARIEREGRPSRALTLASPATGVVVEKNVVQGSRVMPGMDLYRLADLSRVWVEGEVFERDLGRVRPGQRATVTLDAFPGESFVGRVAYLYPSVAAETRTGRVRIELDNSAARLLPGMYARVDLGAATERMALMIPRDAVHVTGTRSLVYVPDASGSIRAREVTTGAVAGEDVEVLAGLRAGERVVASASFLIDAEASMRESGGSMPGMEM